MMRPTHQLVACGVSTTTAAAVGLPVAPAMAFTTVAVMTTMWPDRLERPLMLAHRGVTHTWQAIILVPATAAVLLFAVLAYGPGMLAAAGVDPPPAVDPAAAAVIAALVAVGAVVGYLCHLWADGCTVGGLKCGKDARGHDRRVYFLPRPLRVRVGRRSVSERLFQLVFLAAWVAAMWLLVWPDLQAAGA